ncbi:hypothetical protein FHW18_004049 [Pigmentiphaga litoralis]|uniref:Uncharacterized protein n=1 Tax=Pigmentiphaga litoralis TaxID=516702 RepID=A0A7Y9LPP9_9BURK|nr:hypothetical protein [Pigmentiphaga litoralis]NYE84778.1 hypothetical protein [Pigmentiphaga litoralis]
MAIALGGIIDAFRLNPSSNNASSNNASHNNAFPKSKTPRSVRYEGFWV